MIFELPAGDTTHLSFTHQGLHPEAACFDACSNGWGQCMGSLRRLVTGTAGGPGTRTGP